MINLILFKKQSEFFNYCKNLSPSDEEVIVTPSPVLADLARRKFSNIPTVTIQKFLQDQFNFLMSEEELEDLKDLKLKKSKLLLYLGFLWKQVFPEKDIILFRKAYKFLTDLRSFTLSYDVFENALEDEEESLRDAVLIFQRFMADKNIFDEHKGYYELAERLRSGKLPIEYPKNKKIIFWGFEFFSPLQVDLLKALGIRDEVYLGTYQRAYERSYSVDWVKWIENDKLNLIKIGESESSKIKIKARKYPKNGLAEELKNLINSKSDLKHNFFLATRDFSFEKIQEIPESNVLFRTQVNLLETSLKKLKDLLREMLNQKSFSLKELAAFIEEQKKQAISEQNFLFLKTLTLFNDTLSAWRDLNQEQVIDLFDLELLIEVIDLDAPRNNLFPFVKEKEKGEILPIKMLTDIKEEDFNIICASKNYGSLIGSESYSDNLEKKLAAIGPIRRAGFLFETLKSQIIESLALSNSILVFENGIEEQDLAWSQIFSEIEIEYEAAERETVNHKNKIQFPIISNPIELKTLSATKIQTYLDCPRKFFMRYVGQDEPDFKLEDEVGFNIIGTIEHEVIELYLEKNELFHEEIHLSVVRSVLDKTLSENKINLDTYEYQAVLIEVRDYTKDAISFLITLGKTAKIKFKIEKRIEGKVEGIKRVGSIDCVGEGSGFVALLDFKRSSSSIPSLSDIKNLKKIQALFYRKALLDDNKINDSDIVLWGYINLSQIEESLLICNDEETAQKLAQELPKFKIHSEQKHFENIDLQYSEFELKTLKEIQAETLFSPCPSVASVCLFCELKAICPKKEEV